MKTNITPAAQAIINRLTANGTVTYGGRLYVLLEQAYLDWNPNNGYQWYTARAICPEEIDLDGWCSTYRITWDILNEDAENEEDACDWSNPVSVETHDFTNINNY